MAWADTYRDDKKAKVTIPVTPEIKELFKQYSKEEGSNPVALIREMIKHLITEYETELKGVE